jgi:hypothetical protein
MPGAVGVAEKSGAAGDNALKIHVRHTGIFLTLWVRGTISVRYFLHDGSHDFRWPLSLQEKCFNADKGIPGACPRASA